MGVLDAYYDSSFDGVSFWSQSDGSDHRSGKDVETAGTKYSLGGGDHVYIDMGQAHAPFEIVAGVNGAEYTSIKAKRGVTGTLVWSRGSMSATLLDIIPQPGKAGPLDAWTIQLRFFSTDAPAGVTPSGAFTTEGGSEFTTEGGDALIGE